MGLVLSRGFVSSGEDVGVLGFLNRRGVWSNCSPDLDLNFDFDLLALG